MYTDTYRGRKESTGMEIEIDAAADTRCQPPEVLELGEEPTAFESLLNAATTADERKLIRLIDTVLDEAWRFDTGKALRGELRRLWTLRGLSTRRFYAAFHGLAERRQRA